MNINEVNKELVNKLNSDIASVIINAAEITYGTYNKNLIT